MMFGRDLGAVGGFEKEKALEVLRNGVERDGLGGRVAGKHMHRLMVLYEEFLIQFCDHPPPPPTTTTTGDADRLAVAEERLRELLDVMSESQEARRRLDETRELRAQREEIARNERDRELSNVRRRLEEAEREAKETREELQRSRKDFERAKNEGLAARKELKGTKEKLKDATRRFEGMLEELEKTEKKINAATSSAWVFIDVGMTIAVALVRLEGHLFETATTLMFVAGLWLVRCIVAVVRSRPSRWSWMMLGLVAFGVFLGIGALSGKERFALGAALCDSCLG